MEFANRICPNCKNPNYVVFLVDFSKAFKYKCMNCNHYFNDVEEPQKADMVEIVRCKNCKHRPTQTQPPKTYGFSIEFPEGSRCPCQCSDGFYSWYPNDDWFCANGERK